MDPDPETLRPNPLTSPSTPPIPYPPIDRPSSPSLSNFLKKYTKIRRRQHVFNRKNHFFFNYTKIKQSRLILMEKKGKNMSIRQRYNFFSVVFQCAFQTFFGKNAKTSTQIFNIPVILPVDCFFTALIFLQMFQKNLEVDIFYPPLQHFVIFQKKRLWAMGGLCFHQIVHQNLSRQQSDSYFC